MGGGRLRWLGGRRGFIVALSLITLLGCILRLVGARESLAFDELYLHQWVHNRGFGEMLGLVANNEKTPPLGFVLAWLAGHIGNSPELIRVGSVVAATALLPATGLLGRKVAGKATGLVAALLLALSPFALFYGSEARSYSLAALFTAVAVLLMLRALEGGGRLDLVGWSLASAAALMSHYTAASLLAAAVGWAAVEHRDKLGRIAAAQIAPLAALAAWFPWLSTQVGNSSDELHRIAAAAPLSLATTGRMAQRLLVGHPFADWTRVPGRLETLAISVGFTLAIVALATKWVRSMRAGQSGRVRPTTWLVAMLALAAPLTAIAVSLQPGQSMLLARNLLVSLPPICILAAMALCRPRKPIAVISTVLVAGGLAAGSFAELTEANRPAIARAAAVINREWRSGDAVIDLCCLYGATGPLGREVAVNLAPGPRGSLSVITADPLAWQRLQRSPTRVFAVGYRATPDGPILFDNPPAAWKAAFRVTGERSWKGLLTTVLRTYEPVGPGSR